MTPTIWYDIMNPQTKQKVEIKMMKTSMYLKSTKTNLWVKSFSFESNQIEWTSVDSEAMPTSPRDFGLVQMIANGFDDEITGVHAFAMKTGAQRVAEPVKSN